jgi:hypothetical protein
MRLAFVRMKKGNGQPLLSPPIRTSLTTRPSRAIKPFLGVGGHCPTRSRSTSSMRGATSPTSHHALRDHRAPVTLTAFLAMAIVRLVGAQHLEQRRCRKELEPALIESFLGVLLPLKLGHVDPPPSLVGSHAPGTPERHRGRRDRIKIRPMPTRRRLVQALRGLFGGPLDPAALVERALLNARPLTTTSPSTTWSR